MLAYFSKRSSSALRRMGHDNGFPYARFFGLLSLFSLLHHKPQSWWSPYKCETMFLKAALSCCSVLILMDAVHKTSLYMSSDLYITPCAGYSVQSSCLFILFSYGCYLISWRCLDSLMPSLLRGLWNPYPLLKLSPEIKYTFKFIFVFLSI